MARISVADVMTRRVIYLPDGTMLDERITVVLRDGITGRPAGRAAG